MKRFLILFALIPLISFAGGPKITENMEATWTVKTGGTSYDFIVNNVSSMEGGRQFEFEMTNAERTTGIVSISTSAMKSSTKWKNYFTDGANELAKETTVWTSELVYEKLKKDKKVKIVAAREEEEFVVKGKEKFTVMVDGKEKGLPCIYAKANSGNEIWILDNKKNPIILKMQVGITVTMTDWKTK